VNDPRAREPGCHRRGSTRARPTFYVIGAILQRLARALGVPVAKLLE
jgi:hypothetical protein